MAATFKVPEMASEASTVQIGAHQLYIEWLRPKRNISLRGGRARGGRGRFSYPMGRGLFSSRGFGRGSNQDAINRGHIGPRVNFWRQAPRQLFYATPEIRV